mmetsp:Transcript_12199/g.29636  ORF Transcript_12199/g.29636 Transcript_12199/m.29636 type:complete len:547 (-) Transcript_12199:1174-2814(-)
MLLSLLLPLLIIIRDQTTIAMASSSSSSTRPPKILLHDAHARPTPAQAFSEMVDYLQSHHPNVGWDVYGDFGMYNNNNNNNNNNNDDADNNDKETSTTSNKDDSRRPRSFLRELERDVAQEMGLADAVFMPSGVMAQSIALLIHQEQQQQQRQVDDNDNDNNIDNLPTQPSSFLCHESSHLILHEQQGYRALLHLNPIVVATQHKATGISIPPMTLADIEETLLTASRTTTTTTGPTSTKCRDNDATIVALLLELPHRELGGKLNSLSELLELKEYCRQREMAFHIDGARIFEASAGLLATPETNNNDDGHDASNDDATTTTTAPTTLAKLMALVQPDSLYISCYKGLGGLSGAFLLGRDAAFCQRARVWLRRFGGNLYTLLPYAVAARMGYEREWKLPQQSQSQSSSSSSSHGLASFADKWQKLVQIVQRLSSEPSIARWLTFDPSVPETNLIHGYLRHVTVEQCDQASRRVQEACGVEIVGSFRPVRHNAAALAQGYKVMFEWTMGRANVQIDDDLHVSSWLEFCRELERIVRAAADSSQATND